MVYLKSLVVYDWSVGIHIMGIMRTNIDLDDRLMKRAMAITGLPTKKAVVDEALRRLVRASEQKGAIAEMRGLGWDGDLDALRAARG